MANLAYAKGRWHNLDKPGGAVFFVRSTTVNSYKGIAASDTYDGLNPERPKSTIQGALDKCLTGRGDTVVLLPGSITTTAAITMTNDDVTLAGYDGVGPNTRSGSVIVNDSALDIIQVNANNVTIEGITIDDGGTGTDKANIAVNTASTATDYTGTVIRNCFFDMVDSAADKDCIALGLTADATDGAIGSLVEGCTILDCDQDAIVINVGSEYSVVRNCVITESANATRYGVEVLAVRCRVEDCVIEVGLTTGCCIHNGVAAARLIATGNRLSAIGADTVCIEAIATATQRTMGNIMTATAAGNLVHYTTDNTTPSADANVSGIFAATAPIAVFDTAIAS